MKTLRREEKISETYRWRQTRRGKLWPWTGERARWKPRWGARRARRATSRAWRRRARAGRRGGLRSSRRAGRCSGRRGRACRRRRCGRRARRRSSDASFRGAWCSSPRARRSLVAFRRSSGSRRAGRAGTPRARRRARGCGIRLWGSSRRERGGCVCVFGVGWVGQGFVLFMCYGRRRDTYCMWWVFGRNFASRMWGSRRAMHAWQLRWYTTTFFSFSDSDLRMVCAYLIKREYLRVIQAICRGSEDSSVRMGPKGKERQDLLVHQRTSVCSSSIASRWRIVLSQSHLLGLLRWRRQQVECSSCGRENQWWPSAWKHSAEHVRLCMYGVLPRRHAWSGSRRHRVSVYALLLWEYLLPGEYAEAFWRRAIPRFGWVLSGLHWSASLHSVWRAGAPHETWVGPNRNGM